MKPCSINIYTVKLHVLLSAVLKCEYKESEIKMLTAISREAPLPSSNKKLIKRCDSQMWLDDIDGDATFACLTSDHLFRVYLATLDESHSHTPVREICSEGSKPLGRSSWFLVGELPDGQAITWCKNIREKLNSLSRVHTRHRRQTRQTDRQADMPCH